MSVLNYHRNTFRLRFLVAIFLVIFINFFALIESSEKSYSLQTQIEDSENLNVSEAAPADTIKECVICISPITQKFTLNCKHSFCESCIIDWAKIKLTCPLCRWELKQDQNLKNLVIERIKLDKELGEIDIWTACIIGRLDIVDFHIRNRRDNYISVWGKNLLICALIHDHFDIFTFLIQKGADINSLDEYGNGMLYISCCKNKLDRVKLLLNLKANPNGLNGSDSSPLYKACELGNFEIVELLLNAGASMDIKNEYDISPLRIACINEHLDVIQLLFDRGAKIDNEYNLIRLTLFHNNFKVFDLLIKNGANINEVCYGNSLLHSACNRFNLEQVKHFFANGADPNIFSVYNSTPLIDECKYGYVEIITLLLDAGARIDVKDKFGNTPLRQACANGHLEVFKLLIIRGGIIENKSDLIDLAAKSGHKNMVEYLSSIN